MDTNLIYQFRTVFEAGTIAKASEQLNMTGGALSRAMKRLEEELKVKLFVQSGRNILPTDSGHQFYISSETILKSIESAKRALKKKIPEVQELRVATFEVFSTHFMAWMIQEQKFEHPVTLFEASPGQIEKSILSGLADYGLTYIPELHPDLDHLPIGEMSLGVFVSSSHQHQDLPYAVPITELGINHLQAKSLDGWPTDVPRNIRYKLEMLETALDLTSRGLCKILCPRFIVQIENERLNEKYKLVEELSKIRFPRFKVYAVKKKTAVEDTYFKKLCKGVRLAVRIH
jgi:DNA-binding transcriptional LysR family regulator